MVNQIIEEMAEKLLKDSCSFEVPIIPEQVAKYLKIEINMVDLEGNISGFLATNNSTPQLGVNSNHPEVRQRFTIAHEVGHYMLHAKSAPLFIDKSERVLIYNRDENSSTGEKLKEREANNFAAALLMPKKLLEDKIFKSREKVNLIRLVIELSNEFKVSTQAMGIRLSQLGYIDYNNLA